MPDSNLTFEIWDLAGQANLRPSWAAYYASTHAVVVVADSTDRCVWVGLGCLCEGVGVGWVGGVGLGARNAGAGFRLRCAATTVQICGLAGLHCSAGVDGWEAVPAAGVCRQGCRMLGTLDPPSDACSQGTAGHPEAGARQAGAPPGGGALHPPPPPPLVCAFVRWADRRAWRLLRPHRFDGP